MPVGLHKRIEPAQPLENMDRVASREAVDWFVAPLSTSKSTEAKKVIEHSLRRPMVRIASRDLGHLGISARAL